MTVSIWPSFSSLRADALFRAASEQHAVRQDDGHHAFILQVVETVQQEGEVGGGFGSQPVVLEPNIVAHRLGRIPAIAEGRIGHDRIEVGLLGGVHLAQHVPVIGQRVAVIDFELRVLHSVQQHVHAGEVVGRDVLFLPVNLADAMRPHALAHVQQQRAGATGEVEHAVQPFFLARCSGSWLSSVTIPDRMSGNLLRRIKLACLFARTGGELADQILVGVAQRVDVG